MTNKPKNHKIPVLALLAVLMCSLFMMLPVQVKALEEQNAMFTTSPSEGYIPVSDPVYATAHDAATGASIINTSQRAGNSFSGSSYLIMRSFLFFNTSSMGPAVYRVLEATLSIRWCGAGLEKNWNLTIQDGQPTYPHDPLVLGDYYYDHYSGDGGSRNATESPGSEQWWNISLNGDGMSWINQTGATKLCLRSSKDISSTVPTTYEYIDFRSYDEGFPARLYVTYEEYPYVYHLHGPYEEDTGYLNYDGVNVTVYFTAIYQDLIFLNGTESLYSLSQPLYFHFNFSSPRQYWLDAAEEETATIYAFYDDAAVLYTLSFLDLAGVLDTRPLVEARRYINGTSHIIDRRQADVQNKVTMSLITGEMYSITLRDGSTYSFGDLTTTTDVTIDLILKGLDFPEQIVLGYQYLRVWITRNMTSGTTITVNYQDLLNETTLVEINIYFASNDTLAWYSNATTSVFIADWTSAVNTTDYWGEVLITHQTFGSMDASQYLPGLLSSYNPFSLDFLGTLPFDTAYLIPSFILLLCAAAFSALSARVGLLAVVIMAIFFAILGWLPIHVDVLVFTFGLVIIVAVALGRRRVSVG